MPTYCDIWSSILTKGIKAEGKISDAVGAATNFFQNQLPGCSKVVGLGAAYGTAQAALETASFAVSSAEVVGRKTALDGAEGVLEGVKQTSLGSLKALDAIGHALGEGANIKCIRFLGSIEQLEFELDAIILGKSINIREKLDVSDVTSFAEKIFNKLQDEVKKIF